MSTQSDLTIASEGVSVADSEMLNDSMMTMTEDPMRPAKGSKSSKRGTKGKKANPRSRAKVTKLALTSPCKLVALSSRRTTTLR